jgi:4-hydroxy-2-oxoheptanedioate aldolase
MRPSRIKAKLRQNEPALITTLHFHDESLYEMTSLMGFDGIWMDLEHHGLSVQRAGELMRAARVGVSDIVARPAKGEYMRMARLLEMGAQGIMYPRCDNAAEARDVVRWSKFAPLGTRGIDGGNPDVPYLSMPIAEYIALANKETFIVIQIEDEGGLQNAEAIAAIEGVDVLMLGPADFSILSGFPGKFDDPRIEAAGKKLAEACKNTGKHWGMPCFSVEHTRRLLEMGARFLPFSGDFGIIKAGFKQIQTDFGPLGFRFDNQLGEYK